MSAATRNQPCRCGSGKKTKKCCDSLEAQLQRQEEERQAYLARRAAERLKQLQEEDDERSLQLARMAAGEPLKRRDDWGAHMRRARHPHFASMMAAILGGLAFSYQNHPLRDPMHFPPPPRRY